MFIKSLTAPLALAAALGFGSSAFAQTMVGGQEVSDADMAAVTEHCRTLAMGSDDAVQGNDGNVDNDSVAPTGPDTDAGTMDGAQPTTGNEGNADNDQRSGDPMSDAETPTDTQGNDGNENNDEFTGSVNMEVITLADCQAAGL